MKPKSFIIKLKPYPFEVLFSFNQTDKQFKKSVKKAGGDFHKNDFFITEKGQKISHTGHDNETYETVVRFTKFKKNSKNFGYLVHEIFHVLELSLKSAGIPHDVEHSSECYAYLQGWIGEKVFKKLGYK